MSAQTTNEQEMAREILRQADELNRLLHRAAKDGIEAELQVSAVHRQMGDPYAIPQVRVLLRRRIA